ncbi:uncharacterized protein H6S33_012734 [Morchella sextelata]|uniref:uncharacterized protein n=1 Tax=Morchella sextelata TaxID=1174677 RepID=UPI001D0397A9|nr:uncharacterized protein H6S33_012734 [Morchella sextelata]KAH0609248.1 hypothetical protein H6S33_012734 [Morchella sextelata]
MGWFSSSSSSSSSSSAANPAAIEGVAPNRSQRAKCWEARDSFFQCLDRNDIIDPIKNSAAAGEKCAPSSAAFEKECVGSWVEYFKKRRVMEYNRNETFKKLEAEGAKSVGMPNPVGQAQAEPKAGKP